MVPSNHAPFESVRSSADRQRRPGETLPHDPTGSSFPARSCGCRVGSRRCRGGVVASIPRQIPPRNAYFVDREAVLTLGGHIGGAPPPGDGISSGA